jgi:DNA repair protein RecO (recombination protein O)
LIRSRAPLFGEALPAAALHWVTALTASALPEGQAYTMLYDALAGVIGAIESAPAARGWAVALARYELLVLAELGFGLDLSHCVVTGAVEDLAWVSPKSGAAVSQSVGIGYRDKLLPLPAFLHAGGAADWPDILAGLAITGHFIARDVLTDRLADVLAARAQLLDRLKRAVA